MAEDAAISNLALGSTGGLSPPKPDHPKSLDHGLFCPKYDSISTKAREIF